MKVLFEVASLSYKLMNANSFVKEDFTFSMVLLDSANI